MSAPAVIGFTGVLVAAVATGLLAGRAVREPGLGRIVWAMAGLAMTVALAAESIGFDRGFGPVTFRAVQLAALLLAPLWLAWGLAELTWPAEVARFGARLLCGALTVVGSVILVTDPLTLVPFGKDWPSAGPHSQPPSVYAVNAVQAVAVIAAVASAGLIAVQSRRGRRWPGAVPGTAAVAAAVLLLVAVRFALPAGSVYPLLGLAAAALAWFGASRLAGGPDRAGRGLGRPAADGPAARPRRGHELAERLGSYRASAQGGLIAAPDPVSGVGPEGGWGASPAPQVAGPWAAGGAGPVAGPAAAAGPLSEAAGPLTAAARPLSAAPGPLTAAARPLTAAAGPPPAPPSGPAARPYGRIMIFTLLEDRVAEFDRLAEQLADQILAEPDTLVFVIHLVPNAPLQRIFYEVYRDRAAFDGHENQPYVTRFAADRRPCVLATTVIELRLKYAKVAPLPATPQPAPGPQSAQPQTAQPQSAQPQSTQPQFLEPLPPRPDQDLGYARRRYGGR